MNDYIAWMAAEAEQVPPAEFPEKQARRRDRVEQDAKGKGSHPRVEEMRAHRFPGQVHRSGTGPSPLLDAGNAARNEAPAASSDENAELEWDERDESQRDLDPRLWVHRKRTITMLRRYMRYAIETGRLPTLLGREFFRSQVTRYQMTTFEDRVIFVHDMEKCLERLDQFSRDVLARVVLQEYEQEQAARLLGCTRLTIVRRLNGALDELSAILKEVGMLDVTLSKSRKTCQGAKNDDFSASDCEQGE